MGRPPETVNSAAGDMAAARWRTVTAAGTCARRDALVVLRSADPADKAQIYAGLGLRLIY